MVSISALAILTFVYNLARDKKLPIAIDSQDDLKTLIRYHHNLQLIDIFSCTK